MPITKGRRLTTQPKGVINIVGALAEAHNLLGICLTNLGGGVIGSRTVSLPTTTPRVTNIGTGQPMNVGVQRTMSPSTRKKLSLASKKRWAQRKGVAA